MSMALFLGIAGAVIVPGVVTSVMQSRLHHRQRRAELERVSRDALGNLHAKIREADQWNRHWDEVARTARALVAAPPALQPDALTVRRPLTPATRCDEEVCPVYGCTACIKELERIKAEFERKSREGTAIVVAERVEPVGWIETAPCPTPPRLRGSVHVDQERCSCPAHR